MVPVRGDQEGLNARPFAQLGRPDALPKEGGPLAPPPVRSNSMPGRAQGGSNPE